MDIVMEIVMDTAMRTVMKMVSSIITLILIIQATDTVTATIRSWMVWRRWTPSPDGTRLKLDISIPKYFEHLFLETWSYDCPHFRATGTI